jgi:hypothetical protein
LVHAAFSLLALGIISPWLLLGGLLLSAAPVVIHLLHRRRYQDRPWAAMQFLRAAVRRQARRVRMESLLLLAVRVLLVAAAACAVAQPFFTTPGADVSSAGGRMHHLLVIDGSLSMQAGGEDSAFDRARDVARRIVESAGAGDAFHLLRIAEFSPQVVIGEAAFDRETIDFELQRLAPTEERGDVPGTLRRILPILKSSPRDHHWSVYILSDFQRADWLESQPESRAETRRLLDDIAARTGLNLVDVGTTTSGNLAVVDARFLRMPSAAGESEIEATVRAFGIDAGSKVPVELRIDGRLRETQVVNVPARATATIRFPAVLTGGGESMAEIRLAGDALEPDNHRWLVLPSLEPLDVLVVSGEPAGSARRAADFVETALAPAARSAQQAPSVERNEPMRPIVVPDAELATRDLAPFDCVVLCDVALISRSEAARLASYVNAGGGLIIAVGDNVRPASYHEMLGQDGDGILPARLVEVASAGDDEEGFRFNPGDYAEAIVRPFAGNEDAGLLTTRIDRYYKVQALPTARVLLRFSNDDPAIVERRIGAGRVVLVSTAFDDRWGNWALWPSFLPMMHELVRLAGEADLQRRSLLVGDAIVHRSAPEDYGRPVMFLSPHGEAVRLHRHSPDELDTSSTEPLLHSGPCELQIGATSPTVERYAVNVDTAESELAPLGQALIASELLPDGRFQYAVDWTRSGSARFDDRLGRADLTLWFVLGTVSLLLVEQCMAWNFRVGAALLLSFVVAALVGVSGFRGVLGAALLLALVLVLAARRRRAAVRRTAAD